MTIDTRSPLNRPPVDAHHEADRRLQRLMMIAETAREHLSDLRFKVLDAQERDQASRCYRDTLQTLRECIDEICPPF